MERPWLSNSLARAKTDRAPSPLITDIRGAIDLMESPNSTFFNLETSGDSQPFVSAAVHQHGLAGDVRSALGCEPHDSLRDFAGLPQAFQRSVRSPARKQILLGFSRSCGAGFG